jgi:hypothetical protein
VGFEEAIHEITGLDCKRNIEDLEDYFFNQRMKPS